ncbi:MAG: hypothetical protein WB780_10895 [Candidatus Acidiferrales bacterium]
MKELKRPWIAAMLALFLGGPGCFYLGWRRGVTATLVWVIPVWFVVAGAVRQNDLDPYAAALAFFLLWAIHAPLAFLAYSSCKRRNAEAAGTAKKGLDASQQLKIVGLLVIVLSGIVFVTVAAVVFEFDQNKFAMTDALLACMAYACMALWGVATGIGLLLLRPWARLSSLVFYGLLCISGALSLALIVVNIFARVVDVGETLINTAPFALVFVTMGVQGLRFFKRNDIRRHFGGT